MLFTFKAGTPVFIGNLPLALPANTEFDVQTVKNEDAMAQVLVQAGQKIYGDHVDLLKHQEKVTRDKKQITIDVSYGPGGVRIEKPTEE